MNAITGRIVRIIRHGHTIYGNPIMSVVLDTHREKMPLLGSDGNPTKLVFPETPHTAMTYRISDNASLVYAIENAEFRETPHTFVLTRAGRISHVA